MAAPKTNGDGILQSVLVNYLVSQARTVEASVNRALWALLERNERLASEVFLTEPRINEMEIVIDEHAIRMLRQGNLLDSDVQLIVATLKINNDLKRMGHFAGGHGRGEASRRTGTDDDGGARDGVEMPRFIDLQDCRAGDTGSGKRRCGGPRL